MPSSPRDSSGQPSSQFTLAELAEWQQILAAANRNNILHHCRVCDREWVASEAQRCTCGGRSIERIACWQFPDD
ncbi:MAG: hypothetical protein KME20_23735 [Kaiparowitsia implicata GSE-PSE-MK54-09C]|nr:hypothetical protein [Kaiparowitsia implicata GSE-PSE-MK54-09C]